MITTISLRYKMQENNPIHQAFPTLDVSDSLRQSVFEKTSQLHKRHVRSAKSRRTLIGSLVSVSIIVGVITIGPSAYAIYGMQRISGSLDDCKSGIMQTYDVDKSGSFRPSKLTLYSQGKWRIQDEKRTTVYKDQIRWVYQPKLNQVIKSRRPEGPFQFNDSGFSIKNMITDDARFQWNSKFSLNNATVDGREVEILTIEQSTWPSRSIYYADPKSHMPFKMVQESREGGQWITKSYSTFAFNSTIDPQKFEPNFPTSANVIDQDHLKRDWAMKLEQPLGVMNSNAGKVIIRDFAINERGHIFLIYTDGETVAERDEYARTMREGKIPQHYHQQPEWHVKDSLGTTYFASENFQPYMNSANRSVKSDSIVMKDGSLLQGIWLVPSKLGTLPVGNIEFTATIRATNEETTSWTKRVERADCKLIPEWMLACAMGPHSPEDVLKEEDEVHMVPEINPIDPRTGKLKTDMDGRVIQKYHRGR